MRANTDPRPKTIFCDIDGTLVKHRPPSASAAEDFDLELLEGTIEKLDEWDRTGCNIILVTGRRESAREQTEKQLAKAGIFYDQLIMGLGGGQRFLINDRKPNRDGDYAHAVNLPRNQGVKDVKI